VASQDAPTLMREAQALKAAGRLEEAIGRYEEAVAANPGSGAARQGLAGSLAEAGRWAEAEPHIRAALATGAGVLELQAMLARCEQTLGRTNAALELARAAYASAPQELLAHAVLAEALLGVGEAERASALAGDMRRKWSTSQLAIALQTTAWRILGDRRHGQLCDHGALARTVMTDAAAVAELASIAETGRGALPGLMDEAITALLDELGRGDDPVRGRNRGTYVVKNVRRDDGRTDHVREGGWLSAVVCEDAAAGSGRQGWIRFGQPGVRTLPPLEAEHHVEPRAGLLVLFPSYMWRGTAPFTGEKPRGTFAFDIVPGPVALPEHD
jgi:hypothetical protein